MPEPRRVDRASEIRRPIALEMDAGGVRAQSMDTNARQQIVVSRPINQSGKTAICSLLTAEHGPIMEPAHMVERQIGNHQ